MASIVVGLNLGCLKIIIFAVRLACGVEKMEASSYRGPFSSCLIVDSFVGNRAQGMLNHGRPRSQEIGAMRI